MADLQISSLSSLNLLGVSALRPVQLEGAAQANSLATEDLTQNLFQQNLQAITATGTTSAAELLRQGREATASLLASLTAPQAPAATTPTPDATTLPSGNQATLTALVPTSATTALGEALNPQTTSTAGTANDLGLQTAMRFGAGVLGQGATDLTVTSAGAELVRDATAVVRTGGLRDQTTNPGPEAYSRPAEATNRLPKPYQLTPTAPPSTGLDLMA